MPIARRYVILPVLALAVAGAAYGGYRYWLSGRDRVSTDNAYVHGDNTVIAPAVSGPVVAVAVGDNQRVAKGDVLVRIDDRDFRARVAQAEAELAQARANLETLDVRVAAQQAQVRDAQANIGAAAAEQRRSVLESQRQSALLRESWTTQSKAEQSVADRDKARSVLAGSQAKVETARKQADAIASERDQDAAMVQQAQAKLELARIDLERTVIRAPIDGVVGNKQIREGQYARAGTAAMILVPLDTVWVEANFKETQLTDIRIGDRATVTVDAYPGVTLTGRVESLAPASGAEFSLLPPQNATGNFTKIVQRVPVRIAIDPGHALRDKLRPGLSVIAEVTVDPNAGPRDGRPATPPAAPPVAANPAVAVGAGS